MTATILLRTLSKPFRGIHAIGHRTARRPEEGDRPPAATMFGYADLAGLEAAGVEIGAHSHTHRQIARGPNVSRPIPARAGQIRSQPAMADEHDQHRR